MISQKLLDILVCPQSHQRLHEADAELVADLNGLIERGRLTNSAGARVEQRLEGGLVREDEQLLYPIVDGIPIMLVDEAIALGQLPAAGG